MLEPDVVVVAILPSPELVSSSKCRWKFWLRSVYCAVYALAGFDFDGTLADSADWFFETMEQLAGEFGFRRVAPNDRAALRGLNSREIMKYLEIPAWKLPQIVARMRQRSAADHSRFSLFPGVPELFESLHDLGIAIAIVSSNSEETIRQKLGPACASQVVHYGCGSSLFGKARKLQAMLRATKTSADRTLYIGDEIRDAIACQQAGIPFGAVTWGYASREALERQQPAFVFTSFREIVEQLSRRAVFES